MKSNRTWNHIIASVAGWLGNFKWWGKANSYPSLSDPYHRQRSRAGTKSNRKGKKRLPAPDCIPYTITYHDWLVRELGYDRRLADGYRFAFLNGYKVKMPMPTDLVAL